jgi:hypothetical protein
LSGFVLPAKAPPARAALDLRRDQLPASQLTRARLEPQIGLAQSRIERKLRADESVLFSDWPGINNGLEMIDR